MTHRMLGGLCAVALLLPAAVREVHATMITVNGATVFQTNYEGDTATPLTFTDAGNAATSDFDPSTAQVGGWFNGFGGNGIFESNGGSNGYTVASKQVQITSSTTGPDPGPFEGLNYLRGLRVTTTFPNLWEATPALFTTSGSDTIEFSTAVYLSSFFTGSATLLTAYNNGGSFTIRARLNVNAAGDLLSGTTDTGLNLAFNTWKILTASYTEGASTWTLTYDGQSASAPVTAAGGVTLLSFGGGMQTTQANTPRLYFDAVPEPSTLVIGLLCIAGITTRMRFRFYTDRFQSSLPSTK